MIEGIDTMSRLVGNVSKLRNKANELIFMIQQILFKHMSLEMLKKGQSSGWIANYCLEFAKALPWIYHDIHEIFKKEKTI